MFKKLGSENFLRLVLLCFLVIGLSFANLFLFKPKQLQEPVKELASSATITLSPNEEKSPSQSGSVLGQSYAYSSIHLSGGEYPYESGGVIALTSTSEPTIDIHAYQLSGEAKLKIYKANLDNVLSYLVHDNDGKQVNKSVNLSSYEYVGETTASIGGNNTKVSIPISDNGVWLVN